ncbi:DUF4329 domain-containing protein [Pseudomonas sp. 18175]|uniref:DUF4329 domain-containing protein n=1 Tax=Pseudomonas sp. 18175 TaxID=3390056 RepID=UPI003D1FF30B
MDELRDREKREARLKGHAKLGAITPAFASPDDAARYLHERIGSRSDVEYGSIILRRLSDDLYVATEPVPGQSVSFSFDQLLERGPDNHFVQPEGYKIAASLHSHPDHTAEIQRRNPRWPSAQVKAFTSFFSETDVAANHGMSVSTPMAYLSGPDGTLLRYQLSYSNAEYQYALWLHTKGPWESPHAHDGTVKGAFKKLASVGHLRFLQSSPVWGGAVGDVPENWEPMKPFHALPLTLACGPVFADKAQALSRAWTRIQRKPTARQRVLILKHATHEHYIASEPEFAGPAGWPEGDALPQLPAGFHLYGIYFHARPLPGQSPAFEDWLFSNFVSPIGLAQHIAQWRRYGLKTRVFLYIRMRDEAILRYRFSGSALESQLFTQAADGTVSDNGIQASLHNGSLLTRDFVRQVAAAGELSVEKTSALWDRSGVVGDDWLPYARFGLPTLSAAFLSADDAARYAHRQIGQRREQPLSGLILQRRDGRFVISEPVPTGPRPFAFNELYPLDRQKKPIILAPGHRLHGRYGSRRALSLTDPAHTLRYKWTRQAAELYGQMFHDHDVADLLAAGGVGYLSGAEDSLIALAPATTLPAWREQWQAPVGGGNSAIAKSLEDGTKAPADVVRTLAEIGTLRVVMGNALWGPAGYVELDWGPWVRTLAYQRPESVGHGPVFDSADAAANDLLLRDPDDQGERAVSRYFAFILKHEARDEYVASELIPVTAKSPLLSLTSLYGAGLPEGFACHSLYYTRQWAGNGSTDWLQRFFITPADLSEAITQARANAWLPPRGAPVYIAPPEGALLCYQSPSTRAMFESLSEADSASALQAKLEVGTLAPIQVVRRVASSGSLRVVQSSHCWDRVGAVPGLWNAYEHLLRRRLSPAFLTMDDAARYVRGRVPTGLEYTYGGVILRRDDGWFVATEPLRVPDEVFDIKWVFPDEVVSRGLYPSRVAVVGAYHSRPARQWPFVLSPAESTVYGNMFSTRLLAQSLSVEQARRYHYLLAPDGALIRLRPRPELKYPQVSPLDLIPRPRSRCDWLRGRLERLVRNGELTPSEYVNRVAATFELQVVVGSAMWGEQGRVVAWSAFTSPARVDTRYVQAEHDPACSPVHIRADDAVRYAHERAGMRGELQFGYVMQAKGNGHFVTTLPVTDAGSNLAHRRVFSEAGYPHGHELAGIYVCGPMVDDFHPGSPWQAGDEIFHGLISPITFMTAFYQVAVTPKRAALPLYLSCADGALLKFTVRNGIIFQQSDLISLRERQLSPRDYIRRMAAAGELRIVVPSTHWPQVGVVDAQWQPGRSQGVLPAGESPFALGPVHAHRDDAAQFVHQRAGRFSGQQAISALLERTKGRESHVPVLAVPDDGFPSTIATSLFPAQWPAGFRVSAAHLVFHAGLDQPQLGVELSYRQNFVSWRELAYYVHDLKKSGFAISAFYLTARDGALLSYIPQFNKDEYNLLATTGKWSAEGGYTSFAPDPSHVLSELARIGELRVIGSGDFWTVRTRLNAELNLPGTSTQRPIRDEL